MIRKPFLLAAILVIGLSQSLVKADHHSKILYKEVVAPVLGAKCGGCHGEKKQKGKLRLDSLAQMIIGGSEGTSLVPGKPDESSMLQRVHLPLDDDEHMPPEGKDQLTADEIALLEFWIKSGAKDDATIGSLKASAEITKSITAVLAAVPAAKGPAKKAAPTPAAVSDADKKIIADAIKKVGDSGGNLMAIAQDTPQLRFSALNVAKDFTDKDLEPLKAVGPHLLWLDLARTQITDGGLANLSAMPNLTRLHLENTKISDAALDHVKGLSKLEYLNLYGTGITDAGIAKLSSNKNLKKLFLWQTKATNKGVDALAKAVPGVDINTGWKAPVVVAAAAKTKSPSAPAKKADTPKPAPAKPKTAPTKPVTAPAKPKTAPTKPVTTPAKPKPVPAKVAAPTPIKPAPAKNAAKAAAKAAGGSLDMALSELTAAAQKAKEKTAAANSAHALALKKAEDANHQAELMKQAAQRAADIESKTVSALEQLIKAVEASRKK